MGCSTGPAVEADAHFVAKADAGLLIVTKHGHDAIPLSTDGGNPVRRVDAPEHIQGAGCWRAEFVCTVIAVYQAYYAIEVGVVRAMATQSSIPGRRLLPMPAASASW